MIYADNAATTKLDIHAFNTMKRYLLDEYGNASQPYFFARKPKKALAEARATTLFQRKFTLLLAEQKAITGQ